MSALSREQLSVVMVGHVDHGKSTVIGRLLADTGSLPEGKLEQVKAQCERNAKPFEYAFLLDALKDEQSQGITIDTARSFFKSATRDYILIDAPGHVEFLKNMVTGAARAEAALLVIDAYEGIRENSRRHGYLLSMLGVRQLVVLVNKMDLVNFDLGVFDRIREEYTAFLIRVGLNPAGFVPVAAREGFNLVHRASWWKGMTVLEHLDAFTRPPGLEQGPLRLPVQDVYKFTENNDDRRIWAGTVETGTLHVGDPVTFYPSGKSSVIRTVEGFNRPTLYSASAGEVPGVTLTEEIYVKRGELMVRQGESAPFVGSRFRSNLFWLGRSPLISGKNYKLKLHASQVPVRLQEVLNVLDASDLSAEKGKSQVERHEVAECILETARPVAFDLVDKVPATGRFVLVDEREIAGGGVILEALKSSENLWESHVKRREARWDRGLVSLNEREARQRHKAKFIVLTGLYPALAQVGKELERSLFDRGAAAYYLGLATLDQSMDAEVLDDFERREERLRRLGEVARLLTEAGQIVITAFPEADNNDLRILQTLNTPQEILPAHVGAGEKPALARVIPETGTLGALLRLLEEEDIVGDYSI